MFGRVRSFYVPHFFLIHALSVLQSYQGSTFVS